MVFDPLPHSKQIDLLCFSRWYDKSGMSETSSRPNGLGNGLQNTVVSKRGEPSRARRMRVEASQDRLLACFSATCNMLRASRAAKVPKNAHYHWMATDPTYPERFRQAVQKATRTLEDHAVKLAHEGVRRLVTYKGKPVKDPVTGGWLYEVEYDSQLIMFLLKAYDRKRFGDKIDTTFGPNWNGNLEDLPEEFLKQVLERINAQIAAQQANQLEAGATIDVKPQPPSPGGQP